MTWRGADWSGSLRWVRPSSSSLSIFPGKAPTSLNQRRPTLAPELVFQHSLNMPKFSVEAAIGAFVPWAIVSALHTFYDQKRILESADHIIKRQFIAISFESVSALRPSLHRQYFLLLQLFKNSVDKRRRYVPPLGKFLCLHGSIVVQFVQNPYGLFNLFYH